MAYLLLAALALTGCQQSYIPYFDPAPDATKLAFDDQEAVRIQSRRVLLDFVAAHPDDADHVLKLAASEWSIGRQLQAIMVLDYLLGRADTAPATTPLTPLVRRVLLQKAQYLAWMAYSPARQAAALAILDRFPATDRHAAVATLRAQILNRTWEKSLDPAARKAARTGAIAALDQALAADPHYLDALQLRARLAFEDQDWPLELDLCARWSAAAPGDGRPWYDRGMALQRLGRYDEALPMFQTAVELEPRQPDPWYGLALAHMAAGSRAQAQLALEQVIALAPNDADAYFKLYQLYSEQPLTPERFQYLVRAASLAKRNTEIQHALVQAIRDEKMNRPELLLFGLKNIMEVELGSGQAVRLGPIEAYAAEAERQKMWEESFTALMAPLLLGRRLEAPHPELGLRLLQLANHWIDADTWHWAPPAVELLDPVHPLGAENIGRPVLYKNIMDRALDLGAYMLVETDWRKFHRQPAIPERDVDEAPGLLLPLADQLTLDQQFDLRLTVARLSVARVEHLSRILEWQEVLRPVIPYSNRFQQATQQGVSPWPAWWLAPRWNAVKKITVAGSIQLDDQTANNGLIYINNIDEAMAGELNTGLSRDNYTDDRELQSAYLSSWGALGMLAKLRDPLLNGDTPENRQRHREMTYLTIALAPLLPARPLKGAEQLQTYAETVKDAMRQLPDLLTTETSPRRRAVLLRLYWFWLMRNGNVDALRAGVCQPATADAFEATDPYASACRLWLRTIDRQRAPAPSTAPAADGVAPAAPVAPPPASPADNPAQPKVWGNARTDLEQMLSGLSAWQTVPALKLRMQISLAAGLAMGDDDLAIAAAETLVRIEASIELGQETSVLNLLGSIYELQGRAYPAMYCLRRSLARRAAVQQAQETGGGETGPLSGGSAIGEEIRILQWRLIRLLRRVGRTEMADDQLYRIARLGPDLQPTAESVSGEQSAAKAAALFELAARRMSTDTLKNTFYLCYAAYKMYSADENTEQYRVTYALIALATNAKNDAEPVRVRSRADLNSPTPYKANNAQVLLAFDAAIHGKSHPLLTTPALANNFSAYARDALRLAQAVDAARQIKTRGDAAEQQAKAYLAEAAQSACPGIAHMSPAIGLLVQAIAARQTGDTAEAATAKAAWLAQGGLPECIDPAAAAPAPAPTGAPVPEPAPAAAPVPAPAPEPAPGPAPAP